MNAYEQHKDNADVVENICILLMELSQYSKSLKLFTLKYWDDNQSSSSSPESISFFTSWKIIPAKHDGSLSFSLD